MKVTVSRANAAHALVWTRRVLLVGGAAALGYCGLVLADTWLFQKWASRELDRASPPAPLSSDPGEGGIAGRIEISRIGLSVMILHGTTPATLRRGAGHIPGTSLPGRSGNTGIAGHRDTHFRRLENLRIDDTLIITAPAGRYLYQVVSIEIVSPLDVRVLAPTAEESVTLVTCHPFDFIGSAPNRFIVRARRIDASSRSGTDRPVPVTAGYAAGPESYRQTVTVAGLKQATVRSPAHGRRGRRAKRRK